MTLLGWGWRLGYTKHVQSISTVTFEVQVPSWTIGRKQVLL